MLPSSSSQLARFGQINHYKKFWLLQTQLEKQEQTSTALSLGVSGNANVKESKPLISSNALIANGDHLINTNNIAGHGTCRGDIVTSSASSSRAAAFPYCSNEPGSLKFYTAYTPVISNGRSRPADSPALSLAVNCESVSQPHPINFFNQTWSPSSLSSPASALQSRTSPNLESTHACNSGQVKATLGAEECDSSECSNKKGLVCDNASTSASTSSIPLSSKQHHKLTGLRCNDSGSIIPSSLQVVAALPSSSRSGHGSTGPLRTCSLCGTSKTPLWRSGPDGPKSLCNACGIRVKKTKRLQAAMEAAGAGPEGIMSAPSAAATGAYKRLLAATTKAGGGRGGTTHKRKLSMEAAENQSDPIFQLRKKKKKAAGNRRSSGCSGQQPNIAGLESGTCYRVFGDATANLAGGSLLAGDSTSSKKLSSLFAKDVEEAAILLMALSCGLVLS